MSRGVHLHASRWPAVPALPLSGLAITAFLSTIAGQRLLLLDLLSRYRDCGSNAIDAWLWSDGAVRTVVVGLVEFPLWAFLGFTAGRTLGRIATLGGGAVWYVMSQLGGIALAATNVGTLALLLFLAPPFASYYSGHVLAEYEQPLVIAAAPSGLLVYGCLWLLIGRMSSRRSAGRGRSETCDRSGFGKRNRSPRGTGAHSMGLR